MNLFTTKQEIMYAEMPTQGKRTLYSYIGDFFAWLCVAGLVWLMVVAV